MLKIDIDSSFLELIVKTVQGAQSFSPKDYKILVIYNPLEEGVDDFVPKVLKERFPKYEIRLQHDLVLDKEEIKISLISKHFYETRKGKKKDIDDPKEIMESYKRGETPEFVRKLLDMKEE